MSLEGAVRNVRDLDSLIELLTKELNWEIEPGPLEDITFEWSADELKVSPASAKRLNDGSVFQLRPAPSVTDPPWGIFFVRFANEKIYRGVLRQVLRGLVAERGRSGDLPAWPQENLLFICATKDYEQFTFAHFRGKKPESAVLSTFGWQRGDTHIRTLCEFNLPALSWPRDENDGEAWLKKWSAAFDVERVTDEFFRRYNEIFTGVEREVKGTIKDERKARLFTQKLFNRLMFIYFVQKKGWLSFKTQPKHRYLRALFEDAIEKKQNFFGDRLYWLFFAGMSVADMNLAKETKEALEERRGDVPPLNGGLFEIEDEFDVQGAVTISNDAFADILKLFERYNFTIEESTPLDVQVAVDPEMLGKVFEELVTGRHETGSYYTPRPVVSFMCREALKHYLEAVQPQKNAVAKFVDEGDASDLENPEAVLDALKRVRVCDPACGSGAYLLGMLHELTRLRAALFKSNKIDDATLYERKRWIIENNVYGVDKDKFATEIACLRLWLSLAIESEEPRPLPNLDFKIESGDSLSGPAPSITEKQMTFARTALVNDFRQAKGAYMREIDPHRKQNLRRRIKELREEIALAFKHKVPRPTEGQLQRKRMELAEKEKAIESARNPTIIPQLKKQANKIKQTLASYELSMNQDDDAFDWAVEFAEVFMPQPREEWRLDGLHPPLNDFKNQGTLVEKADPDTDLGGFDIVLANPPYVRADAQFKHIKSEKERQLAISEWKAFRAHLLSTKYYETLYEKWDLYLPFLERAYQLLREGGDMVFIISDAFNAAKYAGKSHEFFLKNSWVERIDFCSDIPLFRAGVRNTILHFTKAEPNGHNQPVRVRRFGDSAEYFEENSEFLPTGRQADFGAGLFRADAADARQTVQRSLPLGTICYISYGLRANSDERYWKGEFVTDDLVSNAKDKKHPKRFVEGKDLVRWWVKRIRYLEWGTNRAPRKFSRPTFPQLHESKQKLIALVVTPAGPPVVFDPNQTFTTHTSCIFVPWHCLRGVRNKSIKKTAKYEDELKEGEITPLGFREKLEELSKNYDSKYLLAVMNSTFAKNWLATKRRSKIHVYPDDWKTMPIAKIPEEEQRPFVKLVDSILGEFKKYGYPLPSDAAERVEKIEREIDERVAVLYGVPLYAKEKLS